MTVLNYVGTVEGLQQAIHEKTIALMGTRAYTNDPDKYGQIRFLDEAMQEVKEKSELKEFADMHSYEVNKVADILDRGVESFGELIEKCHERNIGLARQDIIDIWHEYWSGVAEEQAENAAMEEGL